MLIAPRSEGSISTPERSLRPLRDSACSKQRGGDHDDASVRPVANSRMADKPPRTSWTGGMLDPTGSWPQTGFETISLKDHTERAARRPPVWRIGKHQNAPRLELCFD
jgi:hypothetical protein